MALHPLLQRQLERVGLGGQGAAPAPAPAAYAKLLERISRAYADADQGRYLLERSQEVSSREMTELHAELRASQARLASLVNLSSDWVWEQDAELKFTYVSQHLVSHGVDLAALLMGRRAVGELAAARPGDAADFESQVARREAFRDYACGMVLPDGRPFYIRISGEPVFDDSGSFTGYRGVGSDVTRSTLAEQKVQHLAHHDGLTGLPNRSLFMAQLDRALARARTAGSSLAVFFVDLDRFKWVNDTLGHDAGDELLTTMATRLTRLLRGADTVGRLGGDEFVALLESGAEVAALSKVASRMLTVLSEPITLAGRPVQISASIGVALFPSDAADAAALLKCADTAMYQAKQTGRNNLQFFTPALAQRAAAHEALEGELRAGIAQDQLRLHYQPKFDSLSGQLCGIEALVRWQHPERGLLAPAEFVNMAEESGLIVPMGRWVLKEACRQLRRWRQAGLLPPRCAVNVSVRQFASATLFEDVLEALASTGLEPGAIEIEITESVLAADSERGQQVIQRLHALGVRIAIDDFGTGYSSLSYLKHFPAQTLKIDRSFIRGLPTDCGDIAITQAVIALAHSMGMQVVAEGVETPEQLQYLRHLRCDAVQGFLLGKPVPPERCAAWMAAPVLPAAELATPA